MNSPSLMAQVLEEFAEAASAFGGLPEDADILTWGFLELKRRKNTERRREARELKRLVGDRSEQERDRVRKRVRKHKEERVCVECGAVFVVVVGGMGRPRRKCFECRNARVAI